ncbi:MAG: ABC1 kinase family protein [Thiohalomonadales bacterium]
MNNKKVPTGKLSRAAITVKTTAFIGMKHVAHVSKKPFRTKQQNTQNKIHHEQDVGKILINTLMQLRGTALKIAQMMSMELDMLPKSIQVEMAKACYEVTPLNRAHIRKAFIAEFKQTPEKIFKYFNSSAFAAASLGQVHRAQIENKTELAIKIQYPGIAASIQSDMKLVRGIMKSLSFSTSFLPRYDIIDTVLDRVQKQLELEIDYRLEAENTRWFANNLKLPNIKVPDVFTEYCSTRVLATEYLEGEHLNQWLNNNPDQQQRNKMGQLLFDLFCFQLHELKTLHADPHPGNFIFCENNTIALIDFGCIHQLQPDFSSKVSRLFTSDAEQLYLAYRDLNIINQSLSFEQYQQEFFPAVQEMYLWIIAPFEKDFYDFSIMQSMPKKPIGQMKNAVKHIDGMLLDQMYFDRSYFGLLSMLRKIRAKINTTGLLIH